MRARFIAVLAMAILLAAGCGNGGPEGPTITVGSADFSESTILAEIYAQGLEAEDYAVDRKLNLGAREVYVPALQKGEIDLIPEYTGNLWRFLAKKEDLPDSRAKLADALETELAEDELTAGAFSEAEDNDAIVVTKETADELGLRTVSDLKEHASELVFAGPPECPQRPACLAGLHDVYDIRFKEEKALTAGPVTVTALDKGEIDVALLFSTVGAIADKGFVVLTDDKAIAGFQNVVPVVRDQIVDAYGDELIDLIDSITAKLTTEGLTELNKRVDIDKDDPSDVAGSWLRDNGFI
jgi:osmoprotectant transport system substrate-binding protein